MEDIAKKCAKYGIKAVRESLKELPEFTIWLIEFEKLIENFEKEMSRSVTTST